MSARRFLTASLALLLAAAPALAASDEHGESTLVWYSINFAILVVVLVVVARKPIRTFFADRRDEISGEINSASEMLNEAEVRYAELQRKLVELDNELEALRAASRERANAQRDRILADARAAAERIKADATAAVEREVVRAREQLRLEASELAIELAKGRLSSEITEADRDRLVDEFIGRIEDTRSMRPSGGGGSR